MTIKINKQLILEGFDGIDIAQDLRLDNNDKTNALQNEAVKLLKDRGDEHDQQLYKQANINTGLANIVGAQSTINDQQNQFNNQQIDLNHDLAVLGSKGLVLGTLGTGLGALGAGLGGAALYRTRNQNQAR